MKEVIDLPVSYWDERLSTVMAERQLIAADVSRKSVNKLLIKWQRLYFARYLSFAVQ
ncbi:MAG: Holliday junction resolvase RuvX [Veillonella parvula]|uniref:Holliday junction resolvase RuvX n=1 Tax=Veillonella parvula TaxID=29466 RepID=UPI0039A37038